MSDPAAPSRGSYTNGKPFRILSLDGGGAKGFYTLGVLREIEGLTGCRLHQSFDLIFGTSTGAIIAALLALGHSVDKIHEYYREYVPIIMRKRSPSEKSKALQVLADEVFGSKTFDEVLTNIGIVTTKWVIERPMIFKGNIAQAHGRQGTFKPGFGVTIGDAVQASCSAYPLFKRKTVVTSADNHIELVDGGFCANNPTLYAIADAIKAMKVAPEDLRVISIGVGEYPQPKRYLHQFRWWLHKWPGAQLLQKVMEINTQSMDQLRAILYKDISTVRINDAFTDPKMATDLTEHNLAKLNILRQRGAESYAKHEPALKKFFAEERN